MKILITGATGFIGQYVVPLLLARGHELTVVSRHEKKAQMFEWYKQTRFITEDIHSDTLIKKLDRQDAVMHLAWTGLPNYQALYHYEENLPKDYRFLKTLVQNGIRHVLVSGTCLEYGQRNGCLSEDHPAQPITAYALAKDCLRRFLQELQKNADFTLQWARLFYLFGQGQPPYCLLPQLDSALDQGKATFNLSGGEQLRDYLHVRDAAEHLVRIFSRQDFGGIINICSGKPISIRNLVERHLAQSGKNIHLNFGFYDYPEYEPMAFWGDNQKLAISLGLAN